MTTTYDPLETAQGLALETESMFYPGEGPDFAARYSVPSWGRDGWDAGEWPYVVFRSYKNTNGLYCYAVYVEGDVTVWRYGLEDDRDRALGLHIEWHWRRKSNPADYLGEALAAALTKYPFGKLPARFRGPFTWKRLDEERDKPDTWHPLECLYCGSHECHPAIDHPDY